MIQQKLEIQIERTLPYTATYLPILLIFIKLLNQHSGKN